jgi:integrase
MKRLPKYIYHDGKGGYRVQPDFGYDAEHRRIRPLRRVATLREAEEKLRQLYVEFQMGTLTTGKQTVAEYFTEVWLPKLEGAPSGVRSRESHVRTHIQGDFIAQLQLNRVTALDLDNWFSRLRKKGLGDKTVANVHGTLAAGLNQARRWKLIPDNPVDGMAYKPHVRKRARRRFTPEELLKLMAAFLKHRYGTAFYIALEGGVRPGEVLGLQVGDVDFERGGVSVVRNMGWIKGMGQVEGPTKTDGSATFLPLTSLAMEMLKRHIDGMWGEVIPLRPAGQFLFPSEQASKAGSPITEWTLRNDFQKLREELELPYFRLYDLRQAGGNLLRRVTDVLTLQELMRHENIRTTRDHYLTVDEEAQRDAREQAFGPLWRAMEAR